MFDPRENPDKSGHLCRVFYTNREHCGLPTTGRPCVMTQAQDCYICLQNWLLPAGVTAALKPSTHNSRTSVQTGRNRLGQDSLYEHHAHINWTRQRWRTILLLLMSRLCVVSGQWLSVIVPTSEEEIWSRIQCQGISVTSQIISNYGFLECFTNKIF